MTIKEALITEIKQEFKKTGLVLDRLTDEHIDWKPHEKSMSLGALATHIVELHGWMEYVVNRPSFDFHTDYQPAKIATISELKTLLTGLEERVVSSLTAANDVDWSATWTLRAGEQIISNTSRIEAVRNIVINHLVHHRGQLTVYMRLLDIPVPGIFGPSADDKQG